jgi:hypothetical protein
MKRTIACGLLLFLGGCATVPESFVADYAGAKAFLGDHWERISDGKGSLCYVSEIDGVTVERTAASETRKMSDGKGFSLTLASSGRDIKAKPTKLKIVATHVTAAPIHEIASRAMGQFWSIEKTVQLNAEAGKQYRVAGNLEADKQDVWIVETGSTTRVDLPVEN